MTVDSEDEFDFIDPLDAVEAIEIIIRRKWVPIPRGERWILGVTSESDFEVTAEWPGPEGIWGDTPIEVLLEGERTYKKTVE